MRSGSGHHIATQREIGGAHAEHMDTVEEHVGMRVVIS